jgi:transposase
VDRLTDITVDDLQEALDSVEGTTPAKRLIAAIAYKNGITQSELAEWFAVERKTVYNWLTRLEDRDLEWAIHDGQRPGRPRKLSDKQLDELEDILLEPPTEVGVDAPAWTTDLVRQFISDRYNIDYSRPSCRRLMKEVGLSARRLRNAVLETEPKDREAVEKELQPTDYVWMSN